MDLAACTPKKVYIGFRATYAPIQMASVSVNVLHISARQY